MLSIKLLKKVIIILSLLILVGEWEYLTKKYKKLNYKKYNLAINKFLKKHKSKIIFEPGRSIVGDIGSLISQVIYIKENDKKRFYNT